MLSSCTLGPCRVSLELENVVKISIVSDCPFRIIKFIRKLSYFYFCFEDIEKPTMLSSQYQIKRKDAKDSKQPWIAFPPASTCAKFHQKLHSLDMNLFLVRTTSTSENRIREGVTFYTMNISENSLGECFLGFCNIFAKS